MLYVLYIYIHTYIVYLQYTYIKTFSERLCNDKGVQCRANTANRGIDASKNKLLKTCEYAEWKSSKLYLICTE